ncbi:HNH endonuclease [Kocuria sp.]|uniref:HNH endonuclease n=1 Tax=Kocuria sp. TaxID=1871328 RepID=UPI0026DD7897|nr:hypothetical protein [Kocuria sp.]MDO4920060.1 hypothetical protein [Kocuria sp.]
MAGFTTATRQRILERDGWACVLCGKPYRPAFDSIHHRQPRGMGGSKATATNGAANGIVLCGSGTTGHHGWVESHRAEALELGLLVPKNGTRSPHEVPVSFDGGRTWLFLADDGSRLTTERKTP